MNTVSGLKELMYQSRKKKVRKKENKGLCPVFKELKV